MKRVSCPVAKALKEAGYPQYDLSVWYDVNGVIFTIYPKDGTEYCVAPTYLEVWLWLWREKDIYIDVVSDHGRTRMSIWRHDDEPICDNLALFDDPEEAIIEAIRYLVDNDLIK